MMPQRSQKALIPAATFSAQPDSQLHLPFLEKNETAPVTERECSTISHRSKPSRLFVPLSSAPFDWFASGEKLWELRRYGRRFNTAQLQVGRPVELRRGYNTCDSIWGAVDTVVIAESISEFFQKVPFKQVIPTAEDVTTAVEIATDIIGSDDQKVIGFRVSTNAESDNN